ncbi:hypothetical protein [Lentzea cavernae]|uniref:HNH endonuclease n=1 Tax=Lentzea cavernae TaxID=2020703 RepID=A0ABQ3MH81_9PSEU|nr:hypothetical protein [Lentzea cavernae]GHH43944.1 hypothetical protein GCM10017774_42490 [Lentzea cavernae]
MSEDNEGIQPRRRLSAAHEAALWALSGGTCYAPGCLVPVVVEVRPGVYKKNVQAAHIYGVRGKAARHKIEMTSDERDSFKHIILLCLAHHSAVDDSKTGTLDYPPELLVKWKRTREGANHATLSELQIPANNLDAITEYLESVFTPPVQRLEALANHLQKTGELNADSLAELKQIITAMQDSDAGVNSRVASNLASAADILADLNLERTARDLLNAADILSNQPRQEW